MPGPVWTMALWVAGSSLVLLVSLVNPLSPDAPIVPRGLALAYTLAMLVLLLVLRSRTPGWLIHAQLVVGVVLSWFLVAVAITAVGRVTTSLSLVVMALYVGFWLPMRWGLAYVIVADIGLLVVLLSSDDLPMPAVPWAFITALSVGLVVAISVLVRQLKTQAVTDSLTGLLNRTGLHELVSTGSAARAVQLPRAVVVIDIDGLKVVNDRQGHPAGDELLRRFARDLTASLRPADIAIRSGGDEFLVLLTRTSLTDAQALAERVIAGTSVPCSFGVTSWDADETFEAAWSRADGLMYAHKVARRSGD